MKTYEIEVRPGVVTTMQLDDDHAKRLGVFKEPTVKSEAKAAPTPENKEAQTPENKAVTTTATKTTRKRAPKADKG